MPRQTSKHDLLVAMCGRRPALLALDIGDAAAALVVRSRGRF